jgi:hypothetical protein
VLLARSVFTRRLKRVLPAQQGEHEK